MVSRSALPSARTSPENSDMTISLVTGANKGIGFQIARGIGGTVLVGARDDTRGRAAETALREAGVDAHHLRLDVTDQDTIDAAVKWVADTYGSLDVLVNNAGCPALDWDVPPSEVSLDAVRRTYDTNVVGVIAVTNAFLPLLREAPAARIVNVSSRLASLTLGADENSPVSRVNLLAYNSSKSALNSITQAYAKELGNARQGERGQPRFLRDRHGGRNGPVRKGNADGRGGRSPGDRGGPADRRWSDGRVLRRAGYCPGDSPARGGDQAVPPPP